MDDPAFTDGTLGYIGIDFSKWSETTGISTSSGAVYMVDPNDGATTLPCPVALLTVVEGSSFRGKLNARGKTETGEWEARDLEFSDAGGAAPKAVEDLDAPAAPSSGH